MNLLRARLGVALAMAALTSLPSLSRSQEAKSEDVEIKIGVHKFEAKPNVLYQVTVVADGFQPNLAIRPGRLPFGNIDFNKPNTQTVHIAPAAGKDVTLFVGPDIFSLSNEFGRPAPTSFKYKLTVQPLTLAEKPLIKVDAKLTNEDAAYQNQFNKKARHKPYPLALKAGQVVIIELNHKRQNAFGAGDRLDPYLFLEDANKKIVASDDDGGGNLNSRLMYEVKTDGAYTVIATSLSGNDTGEFTLTVRSAEKK